MMRAQSAEIRGGRLYLKAMAARRRQTQENTEMIRADLAGFARKLFTQDCLLCAGASLAQPLCDSCIQNLPVLEAGCPVCALPSPDEQVCGRCLARPPHFSRTLAAWAYDFPMDRVIQAFKFHHRLELAPWFARSLARRLDLLNPAIIAMPLHNARLAERGFNQALEIAKHLAEFAGGKLLHSAVHKHRETLIQSGLPLEARAKNVRDAFRCAAAFDGNAIVVVDDVMTTGATLNELARILKRAGASEVINLVVARTLPP
jgi:ComF family protein